MRTLGLDCYWHLSDTSVNQIPLLSLTSTFVPGCSGKFPPQGYTNIILNFFLYFMDFYRYLNLKHLEFAFVYNVMEDPRLYFLLVIK